MMKGWRSLVVICATQTALLALVLLGLKFIVSSQTTPSMDGPVPSKVEVWEKLPGL